MKFCLATNNFKWVNVEFQTKQFTIVIFILYKPRIAIAILDLYRMKITGSGW